MYDDRKYDDLWMDFAFRASLESKCNRRKVGAIAVKDGRVISLGWNGTHTGHPNECEDVTHDEAGNEVLTTKPAVIHAEANMIGKLAGSAESARGATIYITDSPCLDCAKQLAVAGVGTVVFFNDYRDMRGVEHLKACNVPVVRYKQQIQQIIKEEDE